MTRPKADNTIEIATFRGLMTAIDLHDAPEGGAEEQVNITNVVVGELIVRYGMQQVSFEN